MKICPVCLREFEPQHPNQRFCSRRCYEIWNNLSKRTQELLVSISSSSSRLELGTLINTYGARPVATVMSIIKQIREK